MRLPRTTRNDEINVIPNLIWNLLKKKEVPFQKILNYHRITSRTMKQSYVYILSNKNRTVLYIGVTSNLLERVTNHKNDKGSVFTKKYNVTDLLFFEVFTNINDAIKREKQLKTWHKVWKWDLIKEQNNDLRDLYHDLI